MIILLYVVMTVLLYAVITLLFPVGITLICRGCRKIDGVNIGIRYGYFTYV